jgi:hypothetical protein
MSEAIVKIITLLNPRFARPAERQDLTGLENYIHSVH